MKRICPCSCGSTAVASPVAAVRWPMFDVAHVMSLVPPQPQVETTSHRDTTVRSGPPGNGTRAPTRLEATTSTWEEIWQIPFWSPARHQNRRINAIGPRYGDARSERRIRHTALRRMHPIRVFGLDSLSGTDWELDEVLAMADPAPMVPRRSQSTRARPIRANLTDASKHREPPRRVCKCREGVRRRPTDRQLIAASQQDHRPIDLTLDMSCKGGVHEPPRSKGVEP